LRFLCRLFTAAKKFENAALFLRLGSPSTLIRLENGAFRKRSSNRRNLQTPTLRFSVGRKHFKNEAFRKRWHRDDRAISLCEFSSNTNLKWPVIVAFSNFSGVVWTENMCMMLFQSANTGLKFIRRIVNGARADVTQCNVRPASAAFVSILR